MKIISKYKDYYDYLQGVYGIDPLLILDRRDNSFFSPQGCNEEVITLFIGGYKIEGFLRDGVFYYGENLKLIGIETFPSSFSYYQSRFNEKKLDECVYIKSHSSFRINECLVNKTIIKDSFNYNERENCAILFATTLTNQYEFYKFPRLSDFKLGSFVSAEEVYKMTSSWLSLQITKEENKPDLRDDVQKLEGKGFDKKTSFRPKMK
jgi:hypothetical protein